MISAIAGINIYPDVRTHLMNSFTRRQALTIGAVTLASTFGDLPGVAIASEPAPPVIDPISLVDPELRPALERMIKAVGEFKVGPGNLADSRKTWEKEAPAQTPPYEVRRIPGPKGAPEVRIIVINGQAGAAPRPAIVYLHGGGFIGGVADSKIPSMQRVALEHECVVVCVDYRLAPETRFPGALEDNYAALKWLYESAEASGADRSRIAVMGESAGGGHAAMLAIAARDRGEVSLAGQILIYPMLDDRTGSSRRVPPFIGTFVWVPASNRYGWTSLLGVPAGSPTVPAGAVPARVQNLAGLPATFIGVGALDLFVEEDVAYAGRLITSGVPTELLVIPGAFHGFDGLAPESIVAIQFRLAWNAALNRVLAARSAT
jgi:acetyl esterase/lipase